MTTDEDLSGFEPRPLPGGETLLGRFVRVEPIDWGRHGDDLAAAIAGSDNDHLWRWIPRGPFPDRASLEHELTQWATQENLRMMVHVDVEQGRAVGTSSYMRIRQAHGSVEVGCVVFGHALQRTPAATEAMHLMTAHAFALGYRRYEWKCHLENEGSARAARRLGFTAEGIFRNDMVVKGRSRDTLWLSIIASEWPAIARAHKEWLDPENFSEDGRQKRSLKDLIPQVGG